MKVSVIVPTYKRPSTLLQALNSLQEQTLREFEIVVVNNALDPRTDEVTRDFGNASRAPVRCIPSAPGALHEARHAGARVALGEILVFTDDDATFDPGWLQAYLEAFSGYPQMAAAGGPVHPVWEHDPPSWLRELMNAWGAKIFGPLSLIMDCYQDFRLGPDAFFYGVNMAIRRAALFEVGGFNPEAFGDHWLGDGESGLQLKLEAQGMPVGYVPGSLVFHHIPSQRMTVEYLCLRMGNQGAADIYTRFRGHVPSKARLLRLATAIVYRNGELWLNARRRKGRTDLSSLKIQLNAAKTRAQLTYVTRMLRDSSLRELLTRTDWLNESPDLASVPA